jgi:hypothetical protein
MNKEEARNFLKLLASQREKANAFLRSNEKYKDA